MGMYAEKLGMGIASPAGGDVSTWSIILLPHNHPFFVYYVHLGASAMRTYVLTSGMKSRLQKLDITLVCWHCGKGFSIGKKVMSRPSNGRTRYWHPSCWEAVRI